MKEFNLKIIEDINFTTYDFDSKLSDYETSADAIIGARINQSNLKTQKKCLEKKIKN